MQDAAADPFTRPSPTAEGLVRLCGRAALVWGLIYIAWRATLTLDGADMPAAGLLLAAEALGLVVFALRIRSASASAVPPVEVLDAPTPSVVAVVAATGSSIDELRTTLVALRRLEGLQRCIVVDADNSRWLRTIAERFDATVAEPGFELHEVVASVSSPWVLRLEAGDLPLPDLLSAAAAACSAPDVGIVQIGIEEADPSSYEHDPSGKWSLEPFEQQVVRPSLAARGSVPFYGDGPVLVRPAAYRASGTGETQLSDPARGAAVIAAGFAVTHLPRTLARVRGPRTLGESLDRRHRRQAPLLRVSLSRAMRGLPRSARVAHRLAVVGPLSALQRVVLVLAAMATMGLAQMPLQANALDLVLFAGPAYLLRWNAHLLLGRGRLGPFSVLRSDLRSLGVDLAFFGPSGPDRRPGRLTLLAALIVGLDVVVFTTAMSVWRDWGDRLPAEAAAVALVITAGFLGVAMEVLLDALVRRQRRHNHRVRLGLVTCRLEEIDGQLVDLSTGGAGVVLACPLEEAPDEGAVTTVSFRIPDADGAWRSVSTLVHIAHRAPESAEETRVGLAFDDPTDAPLDPVVEFLTVDRRLGSLGRAPVATN